MAKSVKNSTIKNLKKGDMNMRTYLEKGTILQLDILDYYMITCDAPIGEGGGGILYSASRLSYDEKNDSFRIVNNIDYALKECFPVSKSKSYSYTRNEYGEVIPETDTEDSRQYLEISKKCSYLNRISLLRFIKKAFASPRYYLLPDTVVFPVIMERLSMIPVMYSLSWNRFTKREHLYKICSLSKKMFPSFRHSRLSGRHFMP